MCFYRLIKGDGEVMEEIVSREQQRKINQVCSLVQGIIGTLYELSEFFSAGYSNLA